ncbi:MAG TPA: tetratricopeptide repeat protein, partial [Blastocatellia bacterium]|nr:tetratricopeptide repeat protein [Blastocatellia bacterium]
RWMVRSQQMRRAAFVSVETNSNHLAVLDALGRQLVGQDYSVVTFDDLEKAILPVERALREQATLLVVDNMESILLPPYLETPELLTEDAGRELKAILALCERLLKVGDTRLVFTSRESLPAPFDAQRNRRELHQLDREDAVKLVERALNADDSAGAGATLDAARESIESLVDAVHGHARTLALLAPALRRDGVEKTSADLVKLMEEMDKRYPVGTPESREKSVFASVELSLRRLSPTSRERVRVLGVFHGSFKLEVLKLMMQWEDADLILMSGELIQTGLATPNRYNHLTLNPALCSYLRGQMDAAERESLTFRWVEAMGEYAAFLVQQQHQNTEVAATLTVLELPNLFALLDLVQRAGDAEATINLTTSLYSLLSTLGKPRLLERVGQVRDTAAASFGDVWNHARFSAARTRIEQQLGGGQLREAFEDAQALLQRAQAAGGRAYPEADYDLAMAFILLARVLKTAGGSEQALPLLDEARQRFEAVAKEHADKGAERMVSVCISEKGECLWYLGRLDEAAAAYEEGIRRDEERGDKRDVAVGKGQIGSIRSDQRRYPEALAAYAEARERFIALNEPGSVAVSWHQTGMAYQEAGQPEAAEDAYRKSLAIKVRLGNVAGQAGTLSQLGILYDVGFGQLEETAKLFRQAAEKYAELPDVANEGNTRHNLAVVLRKLRRLEEARQEIGRAIECNSQFGNASRPWMTWNGLAGIETDAGNPAAAAQAKRKAIACYLDYRRDGGENHDAEGRISLAVAQSLLGGDPAEAASLLQELAARPDAARLLQFIQALQAIVAGSRDCSLADAPDLDYSMAAEILFLIETLEKPR